MPDHKIKNLGPEPDGDKPVLEILERKESFKGFVKVDTYIIRTRRFDGTITEPYDREIMSIGPSAMASVLLPYDPVRDVVILIEQVRLPAYISKRTNGWTLEASAGLIELGDDPEATARRECLEECAREVKRIAKVGHYMPSPGGFNEIIHLYIGEVEAGETGQIAGLASENENIRSHVISFNDAMELVDSDRIDNGNTLIALNWLARHRDRLRAEWLDQTNS